MDRVVRAVQTYGSKTSDRKFQQTIRKNNINMLLVERAVKDREARVPNTILRPEKSDKYVQPIDAARRGTMKPKGDAHLFEGILSGGIMSHD